MLILVRTQFRIPLELCLEQSSRFHNELAIYGSVLSCSVVSSEATMSSELGAQIATLTTLCEKGEYLSRLSM
jgi:hypothetical protein